MDESQKQLDKILRKNLKEKDRLYGIFDGALIEGLWLNLDHWDLNFTPLYRGDHEKIAEAIPYVIDLDKTKDLDAYKLLLRNIGCNACLFIISPLSLYTLTEKMRFFYHVSTSEGESALRRFYDPRIFSDFIKGMNGENRLLFFDSISSFFSEQNKGKKLVSFKKEGDELKQCYYSLISTGDANK